MSSQDKVAVAKLARASKTGLITVSAAAAALKMDERDTAPRLARLAKRGWLQRAQRGLYLVLPLEADPSQRSTPEDPWVLAHEVFSPCYIGGWSAAEHWGFTEQIFRSTLVVTAAAVRATRTEILGNEFRVFRVPRSRLELGVVSVWRGAERVPVSGRERTLIDCLRSPELGGGIRHLAQMLQEYGRSSERDFKRLIEVAEGAASGAAWKRLGYLGELLWPQDTTLAEHARRHATTGNIRLDPAISKRGKLVKRWRLWLNVDLHEFASRATA